MAHDGLAVPSFRDYGSVVLPALRDDAQIEVRAWVEADGVRRQVSAYLPRGASFVERSRTVAELHARLRREARLARS